METLTERLLTTLLIAATVVAGACGGGNSGPPPANMTTTVVAVRGNGQTGIVGQVLADPIAVVVTEDGQPAADVTVTWSSTSGVMTPASGATDADGLANTNWTLGSASGNQTARATVAGASGSPVTFSASALAGAAATLAKAGGDGQTGEINASLGAPVQAKVTDEFGNAVAGTDVNWSATGASVSTATAASNGSGISQVSVTLGGTAGPITITAESSGLTGSPLTGSPLTFNATAVVPVPPPTSIAITVGNDFFRSDRNQTTSPAVDTVAVGGTATWTWGPAAVSHNVTSNPPPGFTGSPTQTAGATYSVVFPAVGTYRYFCSIHSSAAATAGMIGRIVVK